MLKTRVIADNVLNLTDARYFAALGVDYMIFNVSNIGKEAITEICSWVEGVEVLLGIEETLSPEMLDFILKICPAGFVSKSREVLSSISSQLPEKDCFIRSNGNEIDSEFHLLLNIENVETFSHKKTGQKLFVKTTNIEDALSSTFIDGIIVEGEQEEKIGFKNFDELDEIFDKLTVEY